MADTGVEADLLDDLEEVEVAQVVRCARILLRRPLLREGGIEGQALPAVFKHREHLVRLFSRHLGYRLRVERRFARLHKPAPAGQLPRDEAGLSPRGYAYLALTLAVLVTVGEQVLISRLAAEIKAAAAEAGMEVDDKILNHRALVAALRHLQDLGILVEVEGAIAPWASATEQPPEALLSVDTELLGLLVAAPVPVGQNPEDLLADAQRMEQATVAQKVRRRLVEDPAVLYADLPAEQAAYLRRHHRHEGYLLERYFGLQPEFRVEGMLATDPEEYLTDVRLPATSAPARLALLSLPILLAGSVPRDTDSRHLVATTGVRQACGELIERYPSAFGKDADSDTLTARVLELLVRTGLATPVGSAAYLISPVAHRWAPVADSRGPSSENTSSNAADAGTAETDQLDLFSLGEDAQ